MSSQLRFAVENRKRHLIDELIGAGVFKIRDTTIIRAVFRGIGKRVRAY